ncbi:MAG TPA: phenylalanine--tRNA ligase subunit beta [Terriglobales bacterium]|jgi:phenylalanyl-tRNA synthetase beta chain|nr:phenylalanine--tRNA ligase subunit beta [Terriglobales bacterium]
MRVSPAWLREFVEIKADDRTLANELTHAGIAVESVHSEGAKTIFEMDLTTNRVDAMNHYGVARECSALYNADLKPIQPKLSAAKGDAQFAIKIEDAPGCARYTARVIRGIKIAPSPQKIQERLELLDAGRISNAVDASNYTLHEMGHPTHAFDLDLLEGGTIIVRRARPGESLKTLDGVERRLHPEDLVIADAKKPVALAGVMGGFDSMITEKTKNILIESAWFDPASVRKTARRHGMHTDASHRFERGADLGATSLACARVAELILVSGGGELVGGEIDVVARKILRRPVLLRRSEVLRILGQEIPIKDLLRILGRLGFEVSKKSENEFLVELPTWRLDVEREIDLIEEIARVYGFNNFRNTLPTFVGSVVELPEAAADTRLRSTLLALGYDEAISPTFISAADAQKFAPAMKAAELANPLNEEATVMRTSLVPGMLDMLAHNLNHGSENVRLFEAGTVFELSGPGREEYRHICVGATGKSNPGSVHITPRPYSFFDLKGDVETLLAAFDYDSLCFDAQNVGEHFHPGRSARAVMDGTIVARLGQIDPQTAAARKIKPDLYVAELFLDRLYKHALRRPQYRPLSRFPVVERDFSFVFGAQVEYAQIHSALANLRIPELQSFAPADLLRGKDAEKAGIPAGKYSLLLRVTFQSSERTLREDEVATWSAKIIESLTRLGASLRSS